MREITIELTTACSARCIMCVRANRIEKSKHMELDSAKLYIQKLVEANYDALVLGGLGDPLLYPYLDALLVWIREQYPQLSVRVSTTGACLDERLYALLCDTASIVKFSNYGMSKEVYEHVHGGSLVFENVQKNLIGFIEYCHKQAKSPRLVMSFLDLQENHSELNEWIDFWNRYPLHEVNVWRAHNWGGGYGESSEFDAKVVCNRLVSCHYTIWVDGQVSVCCFDTQKKLIIGNLRMDSFEDLDQKRAAILKIHTERQLKEHDIICKYCDQITDRSEACIYLKREHIIKDLRE